LQFLLQLPNPSLPTIQFQGVMLGHRFNPSFQLGF
jgi:hypothetical protein